VTCIQFYTLHIVRISFLVCLLSSIYIIIAMLWITIMDVLLYFAWEDYALYAINCPVRTVVGSYRMIVHWHIFIKKTIHLCNRCVDKVLNFKKNLSLIEYYQRNVLFVLHWVKKHLKHCHFVCMKYVCMHACIWHLVRVLWQIAIALGFVSRCNIIYHSTLTSCCIFHTN